MNAVEDSLRRLQTDYIDLYQSHRHDPDTPLDETLEAYARLMEQEGARDWCIQLQRRTTLQCTGTAQKA